MGTLHATQNWSGMTVNGCLLGDPAEDDQGYLWEHYLLPDGHITDQGEVIVDGPTEGL